MRTADLTKTAHNTLECERVREIGASRPCVLVEELAEVYVEKNLAEFPPVRDIRVVIE